MGRSYTPKYRVELVGNNHARGGLAWEKRYGRATNTNLAKLIQSIEASFLPGGPNSHLRPVTYVSASIVNQKTGELVAFYAQK